MKQTNTKKSLLQEHKGFAFYNKGLKTDMPTEIFMIKVKDKTLLSKLDIKMGLHTKNKEECDEKTGIPYVEPGRGLWMQSKWNSKRFLTKKSAENWLAKQLSPIMWRDNKEEFKKNLIIVKATCNWEEA